MANFRGRASPSAIWFDPMIEIPGSFLEFVCRASVSGVSPRFLLWLYPVLSLVSFLAYVRDKAAARNHARRIPEARLLTLDLLGGWPGGFAAQHLLRHKTRTVSY